MFTEGIYSFEIFSSTLFLLLQIATDAYGSICGVPLLEVQTFVVV